MWNSIISSDSQTSLPWVWMDMCRLQLFLLSLAVMCVLFLLQFTEYLGIGIGLEELLQFFRDIIVPHGICAFQAEDLPVYDLSPLAHLISLVNKVPLEQVEYVLCCKPSEGTIKWHNDVISTLLLNMNYE